MPVNENEQDEQIEKLWAAHGRLREEQSRLSEHVRTKFEAQDQNMDRMREDLRREIKSVDANNERRIVGLRDVLRAEIQTGDANNEKRHNDLTASITQTLANLSASNPVWVTGVMALVVAALGIMIGAGIAWGIAHHQL